MYMYYTEELLVDAELQARQTTCTRFYVLLTAFTTSVVKFVPKKLCYVCRLLFKIWWEKKIEIQPQHKHIFHEVKRFYANASLQLKRPPNCQLLKFKVWKIQLIVCPCWVCSRKPGRQAIFFQTLNFEGRHFYSPLSYKAA